jgi:hypothetical protein
MRGTLLPSHTHLHVNGIMLKLQINFESLDFNKTKERLVQKGNETFFTWFRRIAKSGY